MVDSRTSREGRAVRRRRECLACARRFTTYEYVEERAIQIVKRDGSVEPYVRDKLLRSVQLPCVKRPITQSEVETIVDEVEDALSQLGQDEVESRVVAEMVMERLRSRDDVAYVRFASVYRNFQDLDEFQEELKELSIRRARAMLNENQAELPL